MITLQRINEIIEEMRKRNMPREALVLFFESGEAIFVMPPANDNEDCHGQGPRLSTV